MGGGGVLQTRNWRRGLCGDGGDEDEDDEMDG